MALATPFVRIVTHLSESCRIRVTEKLSAASTVLKAITEDQTGGDNETDVDLTGRVGLPTPPTAIVVLFLAFLAGDEPVAPPGLLPHTLVLLELAEFLGIDTDIHFTTTRWIGDRDDRLAMRAQMQLTRRAKCLFIVKKVIKAWFGHFTSTSQVCFVTKRAYPNPYNADELCRGVDGDPYMYGLDAPNNWVPVVVLGRLPPYSSTATGQASEEGAGDLQRQWMNDLYLLCADDEGRDLLGRAISNHGLYVRALPFVATTTARRLDNIQEFGTTAYLVSISPWTNYRVAGPVDRDGDSDQGRRANGSTRRFAHQEHSRSRSRGWKRRRST